MNEYTAQAKAWLESTGSTIVIKRVPDFMQKPPIWDGPHGYQYVAELRRGKKKYRFDFWDSYANQQKERNGNCIPRIQPTAYDVLACLDTYIDDSVSLGDFMSNFGFEVKDVDKAQQALQDLQKQNRALRAMYNEDELQALNEII
jgi:hypothetical protein